MRRELADRFVQKILRPHHGFPLIEIAFLFVILGGLANAVATLLSRGFLPSPFFYVASDTFMDWFNTAYWAHDGGEYRIWRSIYPPLSFAVLKFVTLPKCYVYDAFFARGCDWSSAVAIACLFVSCAAASFWCFRANDRSTAVVRSVALSFGFPMLFALERGNLCLAALGCFALAWGQLLRRAAGAWLPLAAAISFKPYLVVVLVAQLIERRSAFVERCLGGFCVLYLVAFVVVGTGAPGQVLIDQLRWAGHSARPFYEPIPTASTYASLVAYLAHAGAVVRALGIGPVTALSLLLITMMRAGEIFAAGVLIAGYVARPATPPHRLAALALSLALTTIDAGGYADAFLIFLVFLEKWERASSITALAAAYLLCVPFDISLLQVGSWPAFSYLGVRPVDVPIALGLSALARPGLVLVIQVALCAAVLGDVRRSRRKAEDVAAVMVPT